MQLSIRTGAVNWVNSELWWPYTTEHEAFYSNLKNKPVGMFESFDWVQRVRDLPRDGPHSTNRDEHLDFKVRRLDWRRAGSEPARRGICRIEHEGKWYLGNVVRYGHLGEVESWGISWGNHKAYWVVCGAFNDDGEFIEAEIHQRYTRPESDGGRRSQYLVQVPGDDGSKWTDWTEWSECSATCGDNWNGSAVRTRSRKCLDKDGNEIEPKTGVNCLPDTGGTHWVQNHLADDWTQSGGHECPIGPNYAGEYCPYWGKWSEWGSDGGCSKECGGGIETRNRNCACGGCGVNCSGSEWYHEYRECKDHDHPLFVAVEDKNSFCDQSQPTQQSRECNKEPCGNAGWAMGNGQGEGCLSDNKYVNHARQLCFNTAVELPSVGFQNFLSVNRSYLGCPRD